MGDEAGISAADHTDITNRARGLMAGIAVGNLLGITIEGRSKRAIADRYPDGVVDIDAASGYPDDDDLDQSIVIAEAAAKGALQVEDLGRRFWDWAEASGAGIGGLTRKAVSLYGGARPQRLARNRKAGNVRMPRGIPAAQASQQAWEGHRAGNGALMRCSPLAIRWHHDPLRLVRESVISAVPTHWDSRCGWSCALANLAAASALNDTPLSADVLLELAARGIAAAKDELAQYGYAADAPEGVIEAVRAAAADGMTAVMLGGPNAGFTLLTLQVALACHWHAENFEAGLRSVVEAGGDTDTNAAAAGAILGARFTFAGIPARWLRRVDEIRRGRIPMEWYADRLVARTSDGGVQGGGEAGR